MTERALDDAGVARSRRAWLARAAAAAAAAASPGLPWLGVPAAGAAQAQPARSASAPPGRTASGQPMPGASGPLVQLFGRRPLQAARVFAAGPPAAVLLACLAPERMLGWPFALRDAAKPLLPAAVRELPMLGRLAGRGSTISVDALLGLGPDLIIDAGTVDDTYASAARQVAEQTGVPVALVDGRLVDSPAQLREVGQLLGVAARGQALAAQAQEILAASARVRAGGGVAPSVYLARSADGLETASAGAINAEIIEAAGGRNVAAIGRAAVVRVSMEQVLGWAPDWVLTQDRNFVLRARSDAAWRALPAVREGRLLLAPDLPFGWLDGPPSVNRLLGVKWLAATLQHGQGAAQQALRETLEDTLRFHALFYGVTPPRATVLAWLEGRG